MRLRPARRKKAVLRQLKVTRVDLCGQGVNPDAHVTLAKAKANPFAGGGKKSGGGSVSNKIKMFLSLKNLDVPLAAVVAEVENPGSSKDPKVKAAAAAYNKSRLPSTTSKSDEGATDMSDPTLAEQLAELDESDVTAIGEYVTDLASELDAERAKAADAVEALAKAQADDEDDEDDVLKGVSPEVRERIEKAEAKAAEADDRIATIEKAERTRVFKARAEALVNISGGDDGADSLGAVLEQAEASLDADTYNELERVLTAADTQLNKADDLFKAAGHSAPSDGSSVVERVNARTAELVAKGESQLDAMKQARREFADEVADHQSAVAKGERA